MDAHALKPAIAARARELGASTIRFTTAAPDTTARDRMAASFARGDLQTWRFDDAYAASASDPASLLAGARSVVCIGVAYARPTPAAAPGTGRVSNYAWSHDYHRRLRQLLESLAATIDTLAGEPATRIACDTSPLAERAFAERAGLGWQGKHTNLIAPGLGSFLFLGEIVTTVAIEPDRPLRKTCGACRRCVTACPTGALRGDYTIDARRCISDLTQRTDAVPREMRALIGDWVWGCDLCQDVCPPTRGAKAGQPQFAPIDDETAAPPLQALLRLRSSVFRKRFRRTAMGWRGAAILRRNAAVALGNGLDRADVPALAQALAEDPHPGVRAHAAWSLGRIGSPRACAELRAAALRESEATVVAEIEAALVPAAEPLPPDRENSVRRAPIRDPAG